MRVLRVELTDGPVEIHPYVTVVRGCSPAARQELLDVFAGIPRGEARAGGLIEAHGVLLDLDDASLAMLDLHHDLPVVVGAADLPSRGSVDAFAVATAERRVAEARVQMRAAEAVLATAVASRDDARAALEAELSSGGEPPAAVDGTVDGGVVDSNEPGTPPESGDQGTGNPGDPGAEPSASEPAAVELARANAAAAKAAALLERARQAFASAEDTAAAATTDHAAALGRLRAAEAALEAASERREPSDVEIARRRVADAESAVDTLHAGSQPGGYERTVEEAKEERVAIEAELVALETVDPLSVRLALADLESSRRGALVPSPEATELAERWAILTVDLQLVGGLDDDSDMDAVDRRAAARRRLVQAETELARMETAVRGPVHDPTAVADLEVAHEAVLEARESALKRFGGAKAVPRLEEAVATEEEVLARLGYVTWADYRLGAPSASVATEEELAEQLTAAQRELRAAQAQYDELEASIDAELAKAEVLDRRRRLRSMAVEVLGFDPGDDVEGSLRRHRVAIENTGAHLERLRIALEAAGLALGGEELDEQALTDLATVWLQEQSAAESQRTALEARLAVVDVTLARLEAGERSSDGEPLAAASAVLDEARVALVGAEERAAAVDSAGELERLRAALEEANAAASLAAMRVTHADEQVLAAAAMLRAADEEASRHEVALRDLQQADEVVSAAAAGRAEHRAKVEAAVGDSAALEAALAEALEAVNDAREAHAERGRQVGDAMAELDALLTAAEAAEALALAGTARPDARKASTAGDDLEWYLLARLAAQRAVSYAGSVPMVLDDTLAGLDPPASQSVLERLERMSSTVQIVIVTEELASMSWAENLGQERALVIQR